MGPNLGRAQLEIAHIDNHFPSTFIDNGTTWMAHTAWFIRTQIINNDEHTENNSTTNDINNIDPGSMIILTNDSSQESMTQQVHPTNNIKVQSTLTHISLKDSNLRSSNDNTSSSSSSSRDELYNTVYTVHNINTNPVSNLIDPNSSCQVYPKLSPPSIVIVEESEQQDKKRLRGQDTTSKYSRKRAYCNAVPQAPSEYTSRRPKGLCSPGTAEGRTGQG